GRVLPRPEPGVRLVERRRGVQRLRPRAARRGRHARVRQVTYEMMAAHWPTPAAGQDDPRITARMNSLPEVVLSGTLQSADWANTRLIRAADELRGFKEQPGKDIAVFGSSGLTVRLLEMGLVDELRIMVNPVMPGAGKSAFGTAGERIDLELVR